MCGLYITTIVYFLLVEIDTESYKRFSWIYVWTQKLLILGLSLQRIQHRMKNRNIIQFHNFQLYAIIFFKHVSNKSIIVLYKFLQYKFLWYYFHLELRYKFLRSNVLPSKFLFSNFLGAKIQSLKFPRSKLQRSKLLRSTFLQPAPTYTTINHLGRSGLSTPSKTCWDTLYVVLIRIRWRRFSNFELNKNDKISYKVSYNRSQERFALNAMQTYQEFRVRKWVALGLNEFNKWEEILVLNVLLVISCSCISNVSKRI